MHRTGIGRALRHRLGLGGRDGPLEVAFRLGQKLRPAACRAEIIGVPLVLRFVLGRVRVHPHSADRVLDSMIGIIRSGAPAMIMAVVVVFPLRVAVVLMHAMGALVANCRTPSAARCSTRIRLVVRALGTNEFVVGHHGLLGMSVSYDLRLISSGWLAWATSGSLSRD